MNESRFEQIEEYLNGKMGREEKMLFESELDGNEELSEAVQLYRSIDREMAFQQACNEEENILKQSLQNLNKSFFNSDGVGQELAVQKEAAWKEAGVNQVHEVHRPVRKIRMFQTVAVAAGILGIVLLSTTWLLLGDHGIKEDKKVVRNNQSDTLKKIASQDSATISPGGIARENVERTDSGLAKAGEEKRNPTQDKIKQSKLFAANYQPDNSSTPEGDMYETVIENYNNREYEPAIAQISNIRDMVNTETRGATSGSKGLESSKRKLQVFYNYYYMGLSFLGLNNALKAIPELGKAVENSPDTTWHTKAQWYLALAHLKAGNMNEAKNLLKLLANNDSAGSYALKARKIYDELNAVN